MNISMYQASAPRFVNILKNLSTIRELADEELAARLDQAGMERIGPIEIPKYEDTEQTLAELKARIAKTIGFIDSVKAGQIDGSEDKAIVLKIRGQDVNYTGMQYLLGFAHPNFYFHVTTAYDILRHSGVEIGKRDYIGNP